MTNPDLIPTWIKHKDPHSKGQDTWVECLVQRRGETGATAHTEFGVQLVGRVPPCHALFHFNTLKRTHGYPWSHLLGETTVLISFTDPNKEGVSP